MRGGVDEEAVDEEFNMSFLLFAGREYNPVLKRDCFFLTGHLYGATSFLLLKRRIIKFLDPRFCNFVKLFKCNLPFGSSRRRCI